MNRQFLWLAILFAALSGGCVDSARQGGSSSVTGEFQGEYPIQAIATVGMVGELVRHVGGEHVKVTQIMGAGVDPHL